MNKKCPQCGAPLEENLEKNTIYCPYCGYKKSLPPKKEEVIKKTIPQEHVEKTEYKTTPSQSHPLPKRRLGCSGSLLRPLMGLFFFFVLIRTASLFNLFDSSPAKESINPFDYIEVNFSGPSPKGKAEISYLPNSKNPPVGPKDLSCYLSKQSSLIEGEYIEIDCSSSTYKLTQTSKSIQVSGLATPLTDLDTLSEAAWTMIITNARSTCEKNYTAISEKVAEIKDVKPIAAYLFYNEAYSNKFYQVFQVDYTIRTGEESSRYVAAVFEDLVVWDESTPSMHDSYTMYMGDVISISDENKNIAFITGYYSLEDALADFQRDQKGPMALKEFYFE